MDYEEQYWKLRTLLEHKHEELRNIDLSSSTPSDYMKAGKLEILQEILMKMYKNIQK